MSRKKSDDEKRDEVLRRMLAAPPKPHDCKVDKSVKKHTSNKKPKTKKEVDESRR